MVLQQDEVCFKYRDDILLRAYVLIHKDDAAWTWFCKIKANRKVQLKNLYKMHKSIKKKGQRTPVYMVKGSRRYYPADGATRLGALLALGLTIKCKIIPKSTTRKWRDPITLGTHHFKNMPEELHKKFLEFIKTWK